MKQRLISLTLATTLVVSCMLMLPTVTAGANNSGTLYTVKQDGTGDFTTIQAAADIAQPGDTIVVYGGTYREEVVFPRGGTGEDARITLKAAEGEEVIVTGSDAVQPDEWAPVEDMPGVYKLVKPNSYFPGHRENRGDRLPGWTCDLDQFNPFNAFWRSRANSSSPSSGSGANQKLGYVSCGQVYVNGEPMNQRWSLNGEADGITNGTFGTVAATPGSWIAYVDVINDGVNPMTTSPNGNPDLENGNTTIYANFGSVDPTNPANDTEINVRMQCLTAEWNVGYITLDGFTVMRGAGPKTVDFWQIRAEGMFGAISTNGGYYWIIENCDVNQCRGVAVDYGNGSRGQEDRYGPGYRYGDYESSHTRPGLPAYNGNGPDLYGHHIIRNCNIFDNATNGMFAYRGAYTEIYGCSFVNNNAINTGLASEAYFKNVSGGFGINIHDNYFYSNQTWNTMPMWMDCENDDVINMNNIIYSAGPGGSGFSNHSYELNAGWNLLANNIYVDCSPTNGVNGNMNVINNLLITSTNFNVVGSASQARAGAEGGSNNAATISPYDGVTTSSTSARNRTNRVVEPGTLNEISTVGNPTSRFDGYSRNNKFMGNITFKSTPNSSGVNVAESQRVTGYGEFVLKREDECEPGHVAMPDFSGGVASFHAGLPDVVALQAAGTVFDWTWVYAAGNAGNKPISRTAYGNMADYNVINGVASRPGNWDNANNNFENNGLLRPTDANSYVINGDKDSFSITLNVDAETAAFTTPLFTSEFMGPSDMKQNLGYLSYPPSVDKDILGNPRGPDHNAAGPFADLKEGENTYVLWPRTEKHEPTVYTVKQDGTGDFTTIQAAADVAYPGDTILVYGGTYREEVIFPRGGTGEDARITLKAAEGEGVTVTGSEIVSGWAEIPDHPGVWSITIPGTIFEEDVSGTFFNPYAVKWQSAVRGNYPTCGSIYLNDAPLEEVYQDNASGSGNNARKGLYDSADTWRVISIDPATNDTVVYANFGGADPNAAGTVTESNARKHVITGVWNIGYITVDGFTVLRGCAPKTIDFWRSDRAPMSGGIATNGGYYWIIENCDVSQCRGVAVDFGLGSRTHEVNNGGTPDVYGYHKIRNNKIHDNASNGVMAYCGPYTEIYGNVLANNNAMNTTLLSEAYVKDVNGGWGISIHDNYFYSDKTWGTLAIWLDSETDGCVISNNIIYSETGGFNSTYGAILYETCHGWNVCSNNIVVGGYIRLFGNSVSDTYVINNLIIKAGNANQLIHMGRNGTNPGSSFDPTVSPVPAMSTKEEQNAAAEAAIAAGAREIVGLGVEGIGFLGTSGISTSGSEGATYFANGIGVGRSMRPIVPGELTALGTAPIPAYRDYGVNVARLGCTNRYNKLLNNIFFDSQVTGSGTEVSKDAYISDWVELTRNYEAVYENGSRSSVFYPATQRAVALTSTLYRQYYQSTAWGNRADYNAYYKGASSDFSSYVTGDGYVQDGNSISKDTGSYTIEATKDAFKITITVDESVLELGKQSYLTADGFGPASAYKYLGVDWYPDEEYITKDFFGNVRNANSNVIGPFADLKPGVNTFVLWAESEDNFNPAGFAITGDMESANGAGWTYKSTDTDVEYDMNGILLKPEGEGPFPAVIISHGGGGNAYAYSLAIAQEMVKWGLVCIAPNYTHAGAPYNAGKPSGGSMASEANLLRAHKALDILSGLDFVDMSRVALHGHSMGAYLTGGLAAAYPLDFKVASHTAGGIDKANGVDVSKIKTPYQSHHGTSDTVVPLATGQEFDAALEGITEHELYTYEGQQHNDVRYDSGMFARVRAWYAKYGMFSGITFPVSKIVAGYAANLPVDIALAGDDATAFDLGLYNESGILLDTISVTASGRYTLKLDKADAVAGIYVVKAIGAAKGVEIDCVTQPDNLWKPTVTLVGNRVVVTFVADVTFNASQKAVQIGETTVDGDKISASGSVLTITNVTAAEGQSLVVSGIQYADLFPDYSFTFRLTI
ncbi:MAG: dienelactone hydrolase family protein [Oscillospiraceae bacterium]|jgi:dienelactone hydrolase|nr:dienelactone hydrolase family protein [Oscillospiraceae bacterium]